jgi:hypothetical protein
VVCEEIIFVNRIYTKNNKKNTNSSSITS